MKKLLILLILVCFSPCIFAQEVELEYKFKENVHHKFKEKNIVKCEANIMGQNSVVVTETLVCIDETTISIGEKNKIKQVVTIEESSNDGESNLNEIEEKTSTVYYEVDKFGKNYNVTDEDGKEISDFDADKETPIFPNKKIKVGDTWERKMTVDNSKVNTTCKLEKLYSKNGVDIAKISLVFDDIIKSNIEDVPDAVVKGTGVFYYSINYGNDLYLSYDVSIEINLEAEIEGISGTANIVNNYDYTYWRCE